MNFGLYIHIIFTFILIFLYITLSVLFCNIVYAIVYFVTQKVIFGDASRVLGGCYLSCTYYPGSAKRTSA